jgi:hypothetical protein
VRFDIAAADKKHAAEDQEYELFVFQLPNRNLDGDEEYAAVRPSEELLITLAQDVYLIEEDPASSLDVLNRILTHVFNPIDLREALIESGDYEDTEGDGDGTLSAAGLTLVRTGGRLSFRRSSRRDPLGVETIAKIAVSLVEQWSGKGTGKPQDYLPPSRTTGTRSKRTSSSRPAATRSTSSRKSASRGS